MSADARMEQALEIHQTVRLIQEYIIRSLHDTMKVCSTETAHEITLAQFNTLRTLHEQGGLSIRELAEHLQVSAPSASAMVDRLVEMGMVNRENSETDRRAVVVRITPDAAEKITAFTAFFLQSIIALLERLGPEMSGQWCQIYRRIREILEEETSRLSEKAEEDLQNQKEAT